MTKTRTIADADPDQVKSINGQTLCKFAIDYEFGGRSHSVYLYALDIDQAQRRFNALKSTGDIIGQVVSERN